MIDLTALEGLSDRHVAENALADALYRGHLTLLLGAGVSKGLGLPNWGELVVDLETKTGGAVGPVDDTATNFMARIDVAKRSAGGTDFQTLVREALYGEDLISHGDYGPSLASQPMMNALGAMVMTVARGNVADVFTLNFDDALDWYLHLHGFTSQVVSELPSLTSGSRDVRIFHMHGFLPLIHHHPESPWIILSQGELLDRLSEAADAPWSTTISAALLSKMVLFVGTSVSDLDVLVHLRRAQRLLEGRRPCGFAVGVDMSDAHKAALYESSVVPVSLDSYDDIPGFLMRVCQGAAKLAMA